MALAGDDSNQKSLVRLVEVLDTLIRSKQRDEQAPARGVLHDHEEAAVTVVAIGPGIGGSRVHNEVVVPTTGNMRTSNPLGGLFTDASRHFTKPPG